MEKNRHNSPVKGSSSDLWELSSLGIEFAAIFMLCLWLGNYLDDKFNWSPFGILSGLITGFAYGLFYIITKTRKLKEDRERKDDV